MSLREFNAGALPVLDGGKVAAAFDKCMQHAVDDCYDRPADDRAWVVTVQFEVSPVMRPGGECDTVEVAFQVKSKLPTFRTQQYSMGLRRKGPNAQLVFSEHSLDNVDQAGMFEDDDQ